MPERRLTFLSILIALVTLGLIGWAGHGVFHFLLSAFRDLNPGVAAAVITGAAAVVVSALTVVIGKNLETNALIKKDLREKKIPVYQNFLKLWFKVLLAKKAGGHPVNEKEIISTLSDITQNLMVWGSDDVVSAWAKFRYISIHNSEQMEPSEVMANYEQLIRAMRRDLGHSNAGLKAGDILKLFINDITETKSVTAKPTVIKPKFQGRLAGFPLAANGLC